MNFKRTAEKLENFLDDEFKGKDPIAILKDGSLVYKGFKVKQNKQRSWNLYQFSSYTIDTFNLKACALMAAKLYSTNNIVGYMQIKNLDTTYSYNVTDAEMFKYLGSKTKDIEKKDLYLWRWEITSNRANRTKQEISNKFRSMF
jgi:hypothetical protein